MIALLAVLLVASPRDIVTDRIKQFTAEFKAAKDDGERVDAVNRLGRVRDGRAAKKLAQIAGLPYDVSVRVAAADAVGRIGDPKVGPVLQQSLMKYQKLFASGDPKDTGDQEVAEALIRAIGDCRDRTATLRLVPILRKNNIPLMAETLRTLGKLKDPKCLDALLRLHYAAWSPELPGVTNPRKPLKQETLAAARAITGKHDLESSDQFRDWLKSVGGRFTPPPDTIAPGLPDTTTWAIYSGKGELETLERFDLVLLDPANYGKGDLATVRAVALSGDPQKALAMGFLGFVVEPDKAKEMRAAHPTAILVSRGGTAQAGPHVNAVLVEGLDPKKPDKDAVAALKDLKTSHEVATLALFTAEEGGEAAAFAEKNGFLHYVSPDKEHATLPKQ